MPHIALPCSPAPLPKQVADFDPLLQTMHTVYLPITEQFVDLDLLLALCSELTWEWREIPFDADTRMPIYSIANKLHVRLAANPEYAYSFDVACRLLARYRDQMQTVPAIFTAEGNARWLETDRGEYGLKNAHGRRRLVNAVRFTPACLDYWNSLPEDRRSRAVAQAQALLQSDAEVSGTHTNSEILQLLPRWTGALTAGDVAKKAGPAGGHTSRQAIVNALVAEIHHAPFQPMYRRKATTAPVTGWGNRLRSYFWPNPEFGYERTSLQLEELAQRAEALARVLHEKGAWNSAQENQAVQLAIDIFGWGGVPQNPAAVTPANVLAVFSGALGNEAISSAPMNSGWTKVAAFATAHLEGTEGNPQVIWDSRVATALISRLDRLTAGMPAADRGAMFGDIGTVPGRGGSRPRTFSASWPVGYRRWPSQVSGSALVREMRDILNAAPDCYGRMPLPGAREGNWTTRGVEMVLFMDGY